MSTDTPDTPPPDSPVEPDAGDRFLEIQQSPDFIALRRALRRFIFPVSVAFLTWYALYVILSAFARDFMSTKVVGNINIALVFGLLQFVTTFLIAWLYERYSSRKLEPMADVVRAQIEGEK